MKLKKSILIILLFISVITVGIVSANENCTCDLVEIQDNVDFNYDIPDETDVIASEDSSLKKDTYIVCEDATFKSFNIDDDQSGGQYYVTLCDENGNGLSDKLVNINVRDSNYNLITNSLGKIKLGIQLSFPGDYYYTFSFEGDDQFNPSKPVTSIVHIVGENISKSSSSSFNNGNVKLEVKAPKITVKYKDKNYFKIHVKESGGKYLKNLKLKIKVFTGKKTKTYTVTTDKNGLAKLSTKKLTKGVHKVIIMSSNKKYSINKSSKITVQPVKFKIGKYYGTFTLKQINNIKKAKVNGNYKTITVKTGKYLKVKVKSNSKYKIIKYPVKMSLSAFAVDGTDLGKNKYFLETWSSYGPIDCKTIVLY